ncbi:MAG: hypothetical protein AAGB03_00365 [Pseudomonadota bacterium]
MLPILITSILAGISAYSVYRVRDLNLASRPLLMAGFLTFTAAGLGGTLALGAAVMGGGEPSTLFNQVASFMTLVAQVMGGALILLAVYREYIRPISDRWITGFVAGAFVFYAFIVFTGPAVYHYGAFFFAGCMITLGGAVLTNWEKAGKAGPSLLGAAFTGMIGGNPTLIQFFFLGATSMVALVGQAAVIRARSLKGD